MTQYDETYDGEELKEITRVGGSIVHNLRWIYFKKYSSSTKLRVDYDDIDHIVKG